MHALVSGKEAKLDADALARAASHAPSRKWTAAALAWRVASREGEQRAAGGLGLTPRLGLRLVAFSSTTQTSHK